MILQDQAVTEEVYSGKRAFFDAGKTKTIDFRLRQLERLEQLVRSNEERILVALAKDLGKPTFEAYTSEIGVLYQELREAKKQLARWMEPKRVATPLVLQPSKSFIRHDPLGVVLIIGPWNYPFQLLLAPVIGAIAAGNCIVLKPSDLTPHTSGLI
ncbi:MAG: aldehyde dehydrogenase family protein, partial [Exiguobacterium acetylicum]